MDFDLLFKLANYGVIPAWLMLIVLPNWSVTKSLVHSMLYPLIIGALYSVGLYLLLFGGINVEGGGFSSIDEVRALFTVDVGVLVGWVHYLVFDLFVGAWEARDAKRRGISHWLLIPCLFFTFMAGPLGLLLYIVLRRVTKKGGWSLAEA